MNCFFCKTKKNVIKQSYFSTKCLICNLEMSNLENKFGADVKGIESLRIKNFKEIITKILKLKKNPLLLEIGSGDGKFIDLVKKKKIKINGIEPELKYLINKKYKKLIIEKEFPFKKKKGNWSNKFDFVIFNDTIEHFRYKELHQVLIQSRNFLKKKGFLVINMPTSDGWIYKFSKILLKFGINSFHERLWQKNFSSPHQFYFNEKNLSGILKEYKFKIVHSYFLNVVDKQGLHERISISHKNFVVNSILYILIYLSSSLINSYSKDINFLIFKKET